MTEIRLYNTATREKQPLRPLDPAQVRMYVCGPTVYDRAHIGNARPVVVFDVLYRLLRHVYGEAAVTYVRNFTDIDDKINRRAAESRAEGESLLDAARRITDETIGWYREDMAALGALPPTHEPRATEHVPGMIAMIQTLIDKECAYQAEGHVLFEVAKWPTYGSLSRRPLDEMESGARVEVAPYKRSPLDFVLWKPSDETLPGWESPWGRGRPGWHIECSVMAKALLGDRFDIHGGGIDLAFPHHENELAQSCCVNETPEMASIWMHNEFLLVYGQKMSKSLGNVLTVRDVLQTRFDEHRFYDACQLSSLEKPHIGQAVTGRIVRIAFFLTNYRKPFDWTLDRVQEASKIEINIRAALAVSQEPFRLRSEVPSELVFHLADDLDTYSAIQYVNSLAKETLRRSSAVRPLIASLEFLGLRSRRELALRNVRSAITRLSHALQEFEDLGFDVSTIPNSNDLGNIYLLRLHGSLEKLAFNSRVYSSEESVLSFADESVRQNDLEYVEKEFGLARIQSLIKERDEAKKRRDYGRADQIRHQLRGWGIIVTDTSAGPKWNLAG